MKSCYRIPWLYVVLIALLALLILAYFFQWAALLSALPWLLILACPLMHLMGGHREGKHASNDAKHDDHHE